MSRMQQSGKGLAIGLMLSHGRLEQRLLNVPRHVSPGRKRGAAEQQRKSFFMIWHTAASWRGGPAGRALSDHEQEETPVRRSTLIVIQGASQAPADHPGCHRGTGIPAEPSGDVTD